jgi:hypothetical protein
MIKYKLHNCQYNIILFSSFIELWLTKNCIYLTCTLWCGNICLHSKMISAIRLKLSIQHLFLLLRWGEHKFCHQQIVYKPKLFLNCSHQVVHSALSLCPLSQIPHTTPSPSELLTTTFLLTFHVNLMF